MAFQELLRVRSIKHVEQKAFDGGVSHRGFPGCVDGRRRLSERAALAFQHEDLHSLKPDVHAPRAQRRRSVLTWVARRWSLPGVVPSKLLPDASTVEVTSCVDLHSLKPDVQAPRAQRRRSELCRMHASAVLRLCGVKQ